MIAGFAAVAVRRVANGVQNDIADVRARRRPVKFKRDALRSAVARSRLRVGDVFNCGGTAARLRSTGLALDACVAVR